MKHLRNSISKFVFLLLAISVLVPYYTNQNVYAYNTFGDGTWDYELQGYRFSIVDRYTGEIYSIADIMKEEDIDRWLPSTNIIKGYGCKLQYLYEFYEMCQYDDEMTAFYNIQLQDVPINYNGNKYLLATADNVMGDYSNKLWPVTMIEDKNYDSERMITQFILSSDISLMSSFLLPMGLYCDPAVLEQFPYLSLEPIQPNHLIVIEPLFWFNVIWLPESVYFYGTATEWAIISRDLRNGVYQDTNFNVHNKMGLLTANAGPLSLLPRKNYNFDFNGTIVPIEKVEVYDDLFMEIYRKNPKDRGGFITNYTNKGKYNELDLLLFKHFGIDIITLKDLYGLTIDINNTNTEFRTGTDVILSFEVSNVSNTFYLPPSVSDAGLELHLETLPSSEIEASDIYYANGTNEIVLYSTGLPGNTEETDEVFTTDVFGSFKVPNKAGTWEFMLKAYDANMNDLVYFTNTGYLDDPEDAQYVFSVEIKDISTNQPPNTSSSDLMPYDFTVPASNLYQFGTPSTSTSWSYYTAHERKEPETGDTEIYLVSHTKTAETSMGDAYYPYSYDNIASAKNRSVTNDTLITHSGYGIGINVTPSTSNAEGSGGYQNGIVLFPEYDYATYSMMIEPYGGMACDSNYNYSDWGYRLVQNTNSMYYGKPSKSDYSRVHFTPVWYPDGEYKIQVYMFDCWTPGGMLWDCREFTVTFRDSMYNDWYITR